MKAQINENISKSQNWITLILSEEDSIVFSERFEGNNCLSNFKDCLANQSQKLELVTKISCYRTNHDLNYLQHFPNIELLDVRGGKSQLIFPNLKHYKSLTQIHINEQGKPTNLENINTAKQLKRILIGDFTFGKPVEISDFHNLLLCPNVKSLFFSNAKYPENQLSTLTQMKTLKLLTLNQKHEFRKLAELSVILSNLECQELKAWQTCQSLNGDIKINGKRKPYLNSKTDKERIRKYEIEFENLKKMYAE